MLVCPPNKEDPVDPLTELPSPPPITEFFEFLILLAPPPIRAEASDPDTKFPLPTPINDLLEDSISL